MASTVSAAYNSSITTTETFTGTYINTGDNTVTVSGLNEVGTLNASSSIPASKQASGQLTLSSGAGSLDLTSLTGLTADETVNLTGLKVQLLKLRNLSANANKITVSQGASNAYRLDASTSTWSIPLAPGQSVLLFLDNAADAVGSGRKQIDAAGTGAQILEWQVVAG